MSGSFRAEPLAPDTPEAGQRILARRDARIMATDISAQIAAPAARETEAVATVEACMAWMRAVDTTLSRFQPESELSRLNAGAGRWFPASDLLYEAVEVAIQAAWASGGRFDPSLLSQLEALGYDRDFSLMTRSGESSIPNHSHPQWEVEPAPSRSADSSFPAPRGDREVGGEDAPWRAIEMDPTNRRIRLPHGARLDLGGIAKGWAADIAVERLCQGFDHALINVGGDLRVKGGPQPGHAWATGVFDPRAQVAGVSDRYAAVVTMSRGGLATSGAVRRWWMRDGLRRHHLLDPRSGEPLRLWIDERDDADGERLIATATALSPTAARAEVAAKVALLRGYPDALRAVEASWARYGALGPKDDADAAVALLLVLGNGRVVLSANFEAYLQTWGTDGAALPLLPPTTREG